MTSEEQKTHKKKTHTKGDKKSEKKTHKKSHKKKTRKDPPGFIDDIEMNRESVPVENDPFAPRDGKALLWRNINMTLVSLQYRHACIVLHRIRLINKLSFPMQNRKERTVSRTSNFSRMFGEKCPRSRQLPSWVLLVPERQVC